MDAKDLRVFEAVARHEGMKRAALEVNTVQSNVTARIRALELELGVALFERRPDGMKLTPAGVRLLPYAYEVRAAIDNAVRAATDDGLPHGPLLVGCRKTTTTLHLARLLPMFLSECPEVDMRVRTETSPLLIDLVLERKLEGAFVCEPIEQNELLDEVIFEEELMVLTTETVKELDAISSDTRLIVLEHGRFYQRQLREILARRGVTVTRTMELGTVEAIIPCVAAGLGVTLLPNTVLNLFTSNGIRAHRIPNDNVSRLRTVFVRRRDIFVSGAMSAFLQCARRYSANLKATAWADR